MGRAILAHNGQRKFVCECGNLIPVDEKTECGDCGLFWQCEVSKL